VTAERKKADLKSKENEYDACAGARCGKRKRALTLPRPPTDGENEWRPVPTNLAGATQPLGRRTIFLGHGNSYLSSHISHHHSLQCKKCLTHVGTLVAALCLVNGLLGRDACILEIVATNILGGGRPATVRLGESEIDYPIKANAF
jgi:hypothetical protein